MLLLAATLVLCSQAIAQKTTDKALYLADPYVYEENGHYYIYGTGSPNGIAVYESDDLQHWHGPCGKATGGLALCRGDVWGNRNFWAPEVYHLHGHYYMTLSVDEHILLCESDSPLGPFKQTVQKPWLEERGIDSHIFVDTDGQAYLFWVRFQKGNVIFCAPLSSDLQQIDMSRCRKLIESLPNTWERTDAEPRAHVAEGPFVVFHDGTYFLTYSCNGFRSRDYGVGCATTKSIDGTWTRSKSNPILCHHGGYFGTGHHALFKTEKGKYYMVYHAHNNATKISPRQTLISPVRFIQRKGEPIIRVGKKIIRPTVAAQ